MGFHLPHRALSVPELCAVAGAPEVLARYAGARTVREAEPHERIIARIESPADAPPDR
jgi:predicted nicotinamide N-methyase